MPEIPDFPWDTVIVFGCAFYGAMCLIILDILRQPLPRQKSFECRAGVNWHHRCPDLDCECECHD